MPTGSNLSNAHRDCLRENIRYDDATVQERAEIISSILVFWTKKTPMEVQRPEKTRGINPPPRSGSIHRTQNQPRSLAQTEKPPFSAKRRWKHRDKCPPDGYTGHRSRPMPGRLQI